MSLFKLFSTTRQMKARNTEENEKTKGNTGKGRVIRRKGIRAKSNFNLEGDVKWERDCNMDIMGVHVCACKV